MTQGEPAPSGQVEDILGRLQAAREELMEALAACDPDHFELEVPNGESIKSAMERTADDLNFYYGRLAARALSLPQPPCLERADFASLREAMLSLQVAHRRFTNLLHDLRAEDLERTAVDEEHGTYTVKQVLEMATAQYRLRTQQVQRIAAQSSQRR